MNTPARLFLFFSLLSFSSICAQSHAPIELTDEEVMFPDKLNGSLVTWTEKEQRAFVFDCQTMFESVYENDKDFCLCSMESLMTGVNYARYEKSSDYQKGQLIALHAYERCEGQIKK